MEDKLKRYFELMPSQYKSAVTIRDIISPLLIIMEEEISKEKEKLKIELKEYYRSYK